MSPLEILTEKLNAKGLEVTGAEAEAIAVRSAGSVDAYLTMLAGHEKDLAELIEPPPGPVPPLLEPVRPPPPRRRPRPGTVRPCRWPR